MYIYYIVMTNILNNIWVINLDKSIDRLNTITNNLNELGLKFNRFHAVYGKSLIGNDIVNNTSFIGRHLLLNYSMVGCSLSHKKLWLQLINDYAESYLILEDDAVLNEKSIEIIQKLDKLQHDNNIDIISLHGLLPHNKVIKPEYQVDDISIGNSILPLNLTGYMITKEGAYKLLNQLNKKMTFPIDLEMAVNMYKNDIKYYVVNPFIISTSFQESSINNSNSLLVNIIHKMNLNKLAFSINYPLFVINMKYNIGTVYIFYVILYIINKKYIKSNLIELLIILELLFILLQ